MTLAQTPALLLVSTALDYWNTQISHEHYFGDGYFDQNGNFLEGGSGVNYGFGPKGVLPENPKGKNYMVCGEKSYDDEVMRQAHDRLKGKKPWRPQDYEEVGNNCQDFADALRRGYGNIQGGGR